MTCLCLHRCRLPRCSRLRERFKMQIGGYAALIAFTCLFALAGCITCGDR